MKFTKITSQIRDVTFGKNCTVIEPANLYECTLGDNVFVGPFVEITKGVKIETILEFQVIVLFVI